MKHIFHVAASAAAVCALAGAPAFAQSSGSAPSGGQQGSASGSGATDQAGSQPGSHAGNEGVTGTSPRGATATGSSWESDKAAAAASTCKASASDRAFIGKAAAGGMAEVKLGQLASEKATSADVKKFGQMMVDDHTKANSQLIGIAQQAGVTAPKDLKPQDQALYDRLSKLSGDEFDRTYMRHMVTDHQKDVAEFKKASTSASDASVKQFATDTLPVLQKHLQDAQSISKKVGGGAEATSGTTSERHKGTGTSGAGDHHGSGTGSGSGAGTGAGSGSTPPRPPQQ
jgi:putative membrane protein